jgi:very-short-patch-repair endonuclease
VEQSDVEATATGVKAQSDRGGEDFLGTPAKQVTPSSLPLNKGRCGGVMVFFRQYSIGPYILGFYCPTLRLAVELDGGQHNQLENKEYDAVRSEYLKAHKIVVMRFWNNEVLLDVQSVLSELALKVTPPSLPFSKGEG